jgi:hypothetical protein
MWFDPKTIMFCYVLYGGLDGLVVCRIPRKCGLIEDFRFPLLTYGGLCGKIDYGPTIRGAPFSITNHYTPLLGQI